MILRERCKDPHALLMIGMAALLLANILQLALRWAHGLGDVIVSAAMGILYGISFTLLLMSVRLKARRP